MKFDEALFINLNKQKVMVGSKTPEQVASDLKSGIARVGGFWRHPDYFEAYLYSASLLIEQGKALEVLDEIGLPGFYLQRHALELLLKQLLGWMVDIADLRKKLCISDVGPSGGLMRDLRSSHDLQRLHRRIMEFAVMLDLPLPPAELGKLIEDMKRIEITETWSRYCSSSEKKDGALQGIQHIPKEIVIPIVEFQERLDAISALVASREAFGDSYEDRLYEISAGLSAALDE